MAQTDPDLLARVRALCRALPEVVEQQAWIGVRWRIRNRTFAHVYTVERGERTMMLPAAFADTGLTGLVFRVMPDELEALRQQGPPFWTSGWSESVMGLALSPDTDWDEVRELLTDSYCVQAPRRLADRVAAEARRLD